MDGETRIEHKSRLDGGQRLAVLAELREHGGEKEMPDRLIAVRLEAPAHPRRGPRVVLETLAACAVCLPMEIPFVTRSVPRLRFSTYRLKINLSIKFGI